MCVQNPDERLDQLRRSSLIEFEHLKKDEHPNPPLRALPEHSILGDNEASTSQMGSDGANDNPTPIAEKDFASQEHAPDFRKGSGQRSFAHGDESVAPQHYSSQDFSGSSSTFGQNFSSSTEHHSSSSEHHGQQQMQSGNMTFNLPDFGDGSSADDAKTGGDDSLSPTQSRS
jgi:glycogenin glucosyltransferase